MDAKTYPVGSYENRGESIFILGRALKVTPYFLASIVITAMEAGWHGIMPWCPKLRLRTADQYDPATDQGEGEDLVAIEKDPDEVWNEYISRNVALGGSLTFYEDGDESRDETSYTPHTLTREKLIKGVEMLITKGQAESPTFDDTGHYEFDCDGPQADLVIQYALFGEAVYG